MSLEAASQNALLLPIVATLSAAATGGLVARHWLREGVLGFAERWALLFGVSTLLDAFATAPFSPLSHGPAALWVSIFFVIFGDFRLFALSEHHARPRGPWATAARRALMFAVVTPIVQRLAVWGLPTLLAGKDLRVTFLSYEVIFLVVLALYAAFSAREGDDDDVRAGSRLIAFFGAQYALWALADALILGVPALRDVGFGLRIVPNVMYYGLFVPLGYALSSRQHG